MTSLFCVAEFGHQLEDQNILVLDILEALFSLFERPHEEPSKIIINLCGGYRISIMSSSWNCNDYILIFVEGVVRPGHSCFDIYLFFNLPSSI
jgi:hypothetical protein